MVSFQCWLNCIKWQYISQADSRKRKAFMTLDVSMWEKCKIFPWHWISNHSFFFSLSSSFSLQNRAHKSIYVNVLLPWFRFGLGKMWRYFKKEFWIPQAAWNITCFWQPLPQMIVRKILLECSEHLVFLCSHLLSWVHSLTACISQGKTMITFQPASSISTRTDVSMHLKLTEFSLPV